jgi:hypothetical protein
MVSSSGCSSSIVENTQVERKVNYRLSKEIALRTKYHKAWQFKFGNRGRFSLARPHCGVLLRYIGVLVSTAQAPVKEERLKNALGFDT